MKGEKISVIIPTYNRAYILGKTLDSILAQSYSNWECVIVDDGSTDNTLEILHEYSIAEERIKIFQRPESRIKGANSCRNYGFYKSTGSYIVWFDSDDLMTPDHIEKKVKAVQDSNADFVVAQTANFQDGRLLEPYKYEKKAYGIKAADFILLKIHWYTYDVLLKREIAKKISWNEKMKSWQDYNYFCKMLLITEKGKYLDEVLTHRRLHADSIQKHLTKNPKTFNKELLENRVLTYKEISNDIDSYTLKELIFGMMNICFDLSKLKIKSDYFGDVRRIVKHQLGKTSNYNFNVALVMGFIFNKGYYFLNKAKQR